MVNITNRIYQEAKWIIANKGYGSARVLQTKLKIGYLAARSILELLEKGGFLEKPNFQGIFKIKNGAKW